MQWIQKHSLFINCQTIKWLLWFVKREEMIMAKMRVMVVKYGYAVLEADTESEAIELINDMDDGDFDWSDFDDAQIVDDDFE